MKQPPTRPRYIGQWRPRDEAHWYSTITLNGVEHKIPDGIGAQDGEDILRLLPNVEGNPDLIGLVKNGDMLAYVRDPLRKSLNLFPLPNEKDAFDMLNSDIARMTDARSRFHSGMNMTPGHTTALSIYHSIGRFAQIVQAGTSQSIAFRFAAMESTSSAKNNSKRKCCTGRRFYALRDFPRKR